MLTYSFENIGSEHLYEHLYHCIKEDILSGKLRIGDKLPSKRTLAKHLNISVITVETAYAQLQVEGYIYAIEKKGYFISDITSQQMIHNTTKDQKKQAKTSSKPKEDAYFMDFKSNSIHPDSFPFHTWTKLMREIIASESGETLLKAAPTEGILALREAIASHLYEYRGMTVSPEQIIIGAGTEYIYHLLIQLLGRTPVYAVENPGYPKMSKVYEKNNVTCLHIPLDNAGLSVDKLSESKANIVHLSPSHHFPTGIVMPISRRYELLGWASRKDDRYIIEDDYDCEFRLYGKPIPTLQSIDVSEKVIYMNTFTKSLAPSFRISYMVLPKHLVELYHKELSFYSCTVSTIEQYTLAAFIKQGYFEKHLNRMKVYYRNKRDELISYIKNSKLAPYITISEEDSGLHFLMELKTNRADSKLKETARELGLNIAFVSDYTYGQMPSKEHVMVLNYAGIDKDNMKEAVEKMERLL